MIYNIVLNGLGKGFGAWPCAIGSALLPRTARRQVNEMEMNWVKSVLEYGDALAEKGIEVHVGAVRGTACLFMGRSGRREVNTTLALGLARVF